MKLLETLLAVDGTVFHLPYHQARFDQTFKALFDRNAPSIQAFLHPPQRGTFRVRIVYDAAHTEVEYLPYVRQTAHTFALFETTLEYGYKYLDRSALEQIKAETTVEPILIKNGLITDTTIANIAVWDGTTWLTPKTPLLQGTTRARLIDEKKLVCADIAVAMLVNAPKIAMMNALTGFYEIPHPTLQTHFLKDFRAHGTK